MSQITVTIRGNVVVWTCEFSAPGFPGAEPSSALLRVAYPSAAPDSGEAEIPLTKGLDGKWTGEWNSSTAAFGGTVSWWVKATGGLIAATEGSFLLKANAANKN